MSELQKVASWGDLGQWCWERRLDLERVWQTALPFRRDLPASEHEQSIDDSIRSILRNTDYFPEAPQENKPWVLARLQFASGLLQPCNLALLRIPDLFDPDEGLRFLLLEEWYGSGRECWPLLCQAIAEPDEAECCEASSLHEEASRVFVEEASRSHDELGIQNTVAGKDRDSKTLPEGLRLSERASPA